MTTSLVSSLLIEAPVDRHFAQLDRHPQALTAAVTLVWQPGLRRGNGVVMLASREPTDLFMAGLREEGLDPGVFLQSGQLELPDADWTLRKFMRNDVADWED